ncbi:MAG: DUF1553 domain-containing protein, partial [Planctomycetota bacterium]
MYRSEWREGASARSSEMISDVMMPARESNLANRLSLRLWALCGVLVSSPALGEYRDVVLEDHPAIYLQFDEADKADGRIATNSGKDELRATYRGGVATAAGLPGSGGSSARFNGRSSRIDVPPADALQSGTFSIEFWFRSTQSFHGRFFPGSATFLTIATSGPGSRDWLINAASPDGRENQGRIVFLTGPPQADDHTLYSPKGYRLNDGRWHHIVAVRTAAGEKHLYIDGVLAGSDPDPGGMVFNDTRPLQIGGEEAHPGGSYLDGSMDEVAIYRHELSAERVAVHYREIESHLPPREKSVVVARRKTADLPEIREATPPPVDLDRLPPALTRSVDFVRDVQPLLRRRCYKCHGSTREEGGLQLGMRARGLEGGDKGLAIVPGDLQRSSLILRVAGLGGEARMPPRGEPLSTEEISLLRTWIEQGAVWPDGHDVLDARTRIVQSHWAFQPLARPDVPEVENPSWVQNPVDAFVLARLEAIGLTPAPPASRTTLIRRAAFDLIGRSASPRRIDEFAGDDDLRAFDRLVDEFLASPQFGERWGRHWLDVVRYADSAGYEIDNFYKHAWLYRDWVIRSLNAGKPFDRFAKEQIAGDELFPESEDARIGTGFLTVGPYAYEGGIARPDRVEYQRLTDLADTFGVAFLGLTTGCARCHSHKFDPISQRDYFGLQAIFAASEPVDFAVNATATLSLFREHRARMAAFDAKRGGKKKARDDALAKPKMRGVRNRRTIPSTRLLVRGELDRPGLLVRPAIPRSLPGGQELDGESGAGRRLRLANWLFEEGQSLTARVMVNRVWQGHFGHGLVRTPNDFGTQGQAPTHPMLLDWLAVEFVESGWQLKRLHRLIMRSSTYQMASQGRDGSAAQDPDHLWLSRFPRRRLEAEAIWDHLHATAGTINSRMFGPAVYPPIDPSLLKAKLNSKWEAKRYEDQWTRRGVYVVVRRSLVYPFFDTFNAPLPVASCAHRDRTVVSPQALTLLNDKIVLKQARAFAGRIFREGKGRATAMIDEAFLLAFGRRPSLEERSESISFIELSAKRLASVSEPLQPTGL